MSQDTILLEHRFTLLCEGAADQNFVKELLKKRGGLPEFNFLDPQKYYSASKFGEMLNAIQGDLKSFSRLKGVLIIADSASDPVQTVKNIREQVREAGDFPVHKGSNKAMPEASAAPVGMPPVHITLLPTESTPGGLETLCVEVLLKKYPWAGACLEKYLTCDQIEASNWPTEKLDKARYHCLVAALHRDDPSKAVSSAFRQPKGTNAKPLIDVMDPIFDNIGKRIKDFCDALA